MRTTTYFTFGLYLIASGGLNGWTPVHEQANMAHVHIGHVMDRFKDTPEDQGLLPTALAEAKIALQHARLAAKAPNDLDQMKLHAGHVIHAVDPSVEAKGPGLGYGVMKAASGVAQHIELAAKADGASENVKTHAVHVTAWANNAVKWADQIVSLAQQIRAATSAASAARLVNELNALAGQLITGHEGVGRFPAQGGLQQAQEHMEQMRKGEGLGSP